MQKLVYYTYQDARKWLKSGEWPKAIVLSGTENYLKLKLLQQVKQFMLSPGSEQVDLIHFRGQGNIKAEDLSKIEISAKTMPFLAKRKVVIVEQSGLFGKGTTALEKRRAQLLQLLAGLDRQACLIFCEDSIEKKNRNFLNSIATEAKFIEIYEQLDRDLLLWLKAIAQKSKLELNEAAGEALLMRCNKNMFQLEQELDKLILYAKRAGLHKISLELVEEVACPDLTGNVFKLVDSVMSGNSDGALQLIQRLQLQGEEVARLRFMFMRHLKQLILAHELRTVDIILQKMKVHPFVARKLASQAQLVQVHRLEQLYQIAVELEHKAKSGEMQEAVGFEMLLIFASTVFKRR